MSNEPKLRITITGEEAIKAVLPEVVAIFAKVAPKGPLNDVSYVFGSEEEAERFKEENPELASFAVVG